MLLRPEHANPTPPISTLHQMPTSSSLSASSPPPTALRGLTRPKLVDIGAWARQLQTRRLWTYVLTFSCIADLMSSSSTASKTSSSSTASSSRFPRRRWSSSSLISDHDVI
ncbi:hypothetical protein FF1_043559 [Malus domestica]